MTTTRNRDNPDGGDAERDEADPLGPDEREILQRFADACEDMELVAAFAQWALGCTPTKEQRFTIRSLVAKGLMRMQRGGFNEDGDIVGGTAYGITRNGRQALRWSAQRELPL